MYVRVRRVVSRVEVCARSLFVARGFISGERWGKWGGNDGTGSHGRCGHRFWKGIEGGIV